MDNYPLPDPRMENPGMFVPGKKPVGPVEVDWSHPLARGLDFVQLMRGKGDADVASNLIASSSGVAYSTDGSHGQIITTTESSKYDAGYKNDWSTGDDISIFVIARSSDGAGTIASQRDGSNADWQLYINYQVGWQVAGTAYVLDGTNTVQDGNWHNIGISAKLGTNVVGFIDGDMMQSGVVTATATPNGSNIPLSIGHRWQGYPNTGFLWSASIAAVFIWRKRYLTQREYRDLTRDPYQFLIPA